MRTRNTEPTTPDSPSKPGRPRRRARLGAVVTAFALVATLVGVNAAPASATYAGNGSPGAVTIYKPQATRVVTNSGAAVWSNGISLPAVMYYRSPATTGYQAVDYNITLQRWNPSTRTWNGLRSDSGFNLQFGGMAYTSSAPYVPRFTNLGGGYYYRIVLTAVWKNAYGSQIGASMYVLDGYDYQCNISYCTAGPGWIYF